MKRTSHSESRLKIAGKLDLNKHKRMIKRWDCASQGDIQGSLEQLVQVVHPLNQLERNADQKELAELIDAIAAGAEEHRDVREETTASDDNVENVPPICPETSPAEPIEAHMDVYHVHDGDEDKKIIYTHPIRKKKPEG